jgi:hypothetical protein
MYFEEIGLEGVGWINLAQSRVHWLILMNTVMNRRIVEWA